MKLKFLTRILLPFILSTKLFALDQAAGILLSDFNAEKNQKYYLETYSFNILKLAVKDEIVSQKIETLLGKHVVIQGESLIDYENQPSFNVQSIVENILLGKTYETYAPISSVRVLMNASKTDEVSVEVEGLFEDTSYKLKQVVVNVHPEQMLIELNVIATTHDGIRRFQMVPFKTLTVVKSLLRRGAYRLVVNEKIEESFNLY